MAGTTEVFDQIDRAYRRRELRRKLPKIALLLVFGCLALLVAIFPIS